MHQSHASSRTAITRFAMGTLIALIAGSASFAVPAAQADDISWGINPGGDEARSSFSYELEPGDTVDDTFQITNYGTQPLELSVYAADGTTSANGALELLPASESSSNVGAWVDVDESKITLAVGEETEVGFAIQIPDDAAPGDYVGGMISSYIDPNAQGTVAVDQRLATQLAVRVGGEGTLSLSLADASVSAPIAWNPFAPVSANFNAQLMNEGTLRARGAYTLKILGLFGWGSTSQTIALDESLPGATVDLFSEVPGLWPLIYQQYEITLAPEGIDAMPGDPVVLSGTFWSFPAGWIGILLLIVIVAVVIAVIRNRNYEYVDEEDDDESDNNKVGLSADN